MTEANIRFDIGRQCDSGGVLEDGKLQWKVSELLARPHLQPLPPPGPRAKIKLFNPLPSNFDE